MTIFDFEKHGHCNKFSPNLYNFLNNKNKLKKRNRDISFFRDETKQLYVGYKDECGDLIGARVSRILAVGSKAEIYCYVDSKFTEDKKFANNYRRKGRCAIDTKHTTIFVGDEQRFSHYGDKRVCNWCGEVHKKHEEIETRKRTTWVNE